jgi:hypothetical protein
MKAALLAGAVYFAVLFGAGTAFGLARVLFVSWLADHLQVGPRLADRVAMGGTAFVLLIAAEGALSLVLGGRLTEVSTTSADAWAPTVGFAAQAAACAFPLMRGGSFAMPTDQA